MKKLLLLGCVAAMAVVGLAGPSVQAKEPAKLEPLDSKTALAGPRHRRGHRGPRRGGFYIGGGHWRGPRYGYYHRPRVRYYAPAPIIVAPPPVVYHGCY